FFFSSRRRHTRFSRDWSSDVCSSDLPIVLIFGLILAILRITRNPVFFPLRAVSIFYIDLFRGAPALLVIFMLGFGVPGLRIESLDRKSTRLNSSHVKISYAVVCLNTT